MAISTDNLPGQQTRAASCPEHGAYEARHIVGRIWSSCPACEQARRDDEDAEARAEEMRKASRRHHELLGRAAIPARFVGKTFAGFVADTPDKMRALSMARDFAEGFGEHARAGRGLVLSGRPGTGKTHLAGAILQTVMPRDVLYVTCLDLIRLVRETWRRDSARTEREVLARLGAVDLLAIDEMGVQYGTEGEQTILFDVLDLRYRQMRPTILLTNQDAAGLEVFLGERTMDRVRETCRWVPFSWDSYRPQARKEAAA